MGSFALIQGMCGGTRPATNVRHVIFDLDGTLFDTAPDIAAALRRAIGDSSCDAVVEKAVRQGLPLDEMIRVVLGPFISDGERHRITADFRRYYDVSDYAGTRPYPGIPELLTRLKDSGRDLHIATNKRERPTLRILQHKGMRDLFSQIVCVDSAGMKRTKKQLLEQILSTAHTVPSEAVFVGDSTADVVAGRELGIRTVGVLYGYGERQAMQAAGPDAICEQVEELLAGVLFAG